MSVCPAVSTACIEGTALTWINTKNYWKQKREIVREVVRDDKRNLRKSADRKAQIREAFVPLTGLICAFRSADFLR